MKPSSRAKLLEDLERSGIGKEHLAKIGFELMTGKQCAKFLARKVSSSVLAYKIPFFDHKGKRISFSRLRILEGTWNNGFKSDKKGKDKLPKNYKYNQRANTAPHLYFPNVIKWPTKNGKIKLKRLVITEGEKKAVKACLTGIPTVALAGVWNYKSGKKHITMLDEFKLFDLRKTKVEICYDSDLSSNEHVRAAINGLAAEIARLKPKSVSFVMLDGDSTEDSKVGLDDYLAGFRSEREAREGFEDLPRKSDTRMDSMALFDRTICMVKEHSLFYNIEQNKYYRGRQQLFDEFDRLPKVPDPEDARKQISGIKLWFDFRAEHTDIHRVVYHPGKPERFREEGQSCDSLNTWRPSNVAPVKGKPALWLELFEHLTSGLVSEHRQWFLQWLAYPIQCAGTKLFQNVFAYSKKQGVGKNFLVEPFLAQIYGKNWNLIDGSLMGTNYNSWAAEKEFVFMDEIYMQTRLDRRAVMSSLKALTTNPTFQMNEKYQPVKSLGNYANIYMTSNWPESLMLDWDDRRTFVLHCPEERLPAAFYRSLDKWADKDGERKGIGQVLNYLREDVDVSDFNVKGDAPRTEARSDVIKFSADNTTHLIEVLLTQPSLIFQVDGALPDKHLWTANELNAAVNKYAQQIGMSGMACSPQGLASYLHHRMPEGLRRAIKTRVVGKSTTICMYAIFEQGKWLKKDNSQWLLHYKKNDPRFRDELKNVVEIDSKRA